MVNSNDKTHQANGQQLSYYWLGTGIFKCRKWWIEPGFIALNLSLIWQSHHSRVIRYGWVDQFVEKTSLSHFEIQITGTHLQFWAWKIMTPSKRQRSEQERIDFYFTIQPKHKVILYYTLMKKSSTLILFTYEIMFNPKRPRLS